MFIWFGWESFFFYFCCVKVEDSGEGFFFICILFRVRLKKGIVFIFILLNINYKDKELIYLFFILIRFLRGDNFYNA